MGALQNDSCCDWRAASEHSPAPPQAGAQNPPNSSDAGLGTSADKAKAEKPTFLLPILQGATKAPKQKAARAYFHVLPSTSGFPSHDPHLLGSEGLGITPTTALSWRSHTRHRNINQASDTGKRDFGNSLSNRGNNACVAGSSKM